MELSLDRATDKESDLRGRVSDLDALLAQRRSEADRALASAASLRSANESLSQQNLAIGAANKSISERLIPQLILSYVNNLHPNTLDLGLTADYEFLYDTSDAGFRESSDGKPASYLFFADTPDDLKAGHVPADDICQLDKNVVLVGFVQAFSPNRTYTISLLSTKKSVVYDNLCKVLSAYSDAMYMGKHYHVPSYRILKGGADNLYVAFIPGSYGGTSYEEMHAAGFWLPMLGQLFQKEYVKNFDNSILASTPVGPLLRGETVTVSLAANMDSMEAAAEQELQNAKLSGLQDEIRKFYESWLDHLNDVGTHPRSAREPLKIAGKFNQNLPRETTSSILSDSLWSDNLALKRFNYDLNCQATRFAVENSYVSAVSASEYNSCVDAERIGDHMAARMEQWRILSLPELKREKLR